MWEKGRGGGMKAVIDEYCPNYAPWIPSGLIRYLLGLFTGPGLGSGSGSGSGPSIPGPVNKPTKHHAKNTFNFSRCSKGDE